MTLISSRLPLPPSQNFWKQLGSMGLLGITAPGMVHVLMRDEKEERSEHGQTNNKAKQHSTPKAVTFPKKNELPRVEHKHVCVYAAITAPHVYMYIHVYCLAKAFHTTLYKISSLLLHGWCRVIWWLCSRLPGALCCD